MQKQSFFIVFLYSVSLFFHQNILSSEVSAKTRAHVLQILKCNDDDIKTILPLPGNAIYIEKQNSTKIVLFQGIIRTTYPNGIKVLKDKNFGETSITLPSGYSQETDMYGRKSFRDPNGWRIQQLPEGISFSNLDM